ncbi:MAG: hypothetical protein LBV00_04500 [Propionibacteriaceae bacterium]|jgi:hypothetical protein|nr:hypothetical protein [Propionibacteriaceae bacterium]
MRQRRLVAVYCAVHGVAEFWTALLLFSWQSVWSDFAYLVLVYNCLAFGAPILVALGVSTWGRQRLNPRLCGLAGAMILSVGLLLAPSGAVCVVVMGVGSALLHIGAGTASLRCLRPGTAVGVFESSGAVGLAIGGLLGAGVWQFVGQVPWVLCGVVVMVIGGLVVWRWGNASWPDRGAVGAAQPVDRLAASVVAPPLPAASQGSASFEDPLVSTGSVPLAPPPRAARAPMAGRRWAPIALSVLAVVSIGRGIIGAELAELADLAGSTPLIVVVLAVALGLGRALGGTLTDHIGASQTAIAGFVAAGLMLSFAACGWWVLAVASCLVGVTMAAMIVWLLRVVERPSWAFGLAQLFQAPTALVGALVLDQWAVVAGLVGCALVMTGLAWLGRSSRKGEHASA